MSKLLVFNQITPDGYFAGVNGDISWAHRPEKDEEVDSFVADNARSEGVLVFGRITYELMASYWPTPQARGRSGRGRTDEHVAKGRVFADPGSGDVEQDRAGEGWPGGGDPQAEGFRERT